jgi:hypothetical protein
MAHCVTGLLYAMVLRCCYRRTNVAARTFGGGSGASWVLGREQVIGTRPSSSACGG